MFQPAIIVKGIKVQPAGPGNLLLVPLGGGEGSRGGEFGENPVSLKTEHLLKLLSSSVRLGC